MQTLVQRIISKVTSKKAGAENGEKSMAAGRRWFLFSSVWLGAVSLVRGFVWPVTAMAAPLVGKKKSTLPEVGRDLIVDKQPGGGTQTVVSDWPAWINGAKRGIKEGVPIWVQGFRFPGIAVNGPIASGGHLEATNDLKSLIVSRMLEAGAPQLVVDGFMGAVAEAWLSWMASVSVPFLPWYPAFAAFPGPIAPPMPNVPCPLALLAQNPAPLAPETLAKAIKGRVGDVANLPGGSDAIVEFCRWMSTGFVGWLPRAQVTLVLGRGPIPTFAPPYVPVGPVVGGDTLGFIAIPTNPIWQ